MVNPTLQQKQTANTESVVVAVTLPKPKFPSKQLHRWRRMLVLVVRCASISGDSEARLHPTMFKRLTKDLQWLNNKKRMTNKRLIA